ncbi:hypothetical protein BCR39DRAFT_532257 [Naematelia encephala]|uniref:RRM domain-containing protein n=1 Tax=Naematelia encephala TaxID=71784 RepID=A0A1Y2B3A2_9TREE|nr:hypothetical protein BCR39DRAFT_532257 [Naematelia encephala]
MALADFFADTTSGNWADEMDTLPTAPAARDPSAPKRGEPGYLDSMPDRAARTSFTGLPPREQLPIPTSPPYTAFIGNLTFETDETELAGFFADLEAFGARIVKDPTGKPKGFGYVEFPSADKLKEALDRNMTQMGGRTIRVSVAEPAQKREGFAASVADEAGQWRRTTPLPAREAAPAARRTSSFNTGAEAQPDRDWGAARGSRFTPSANVPPTPSGLRRESGGPDRERDFAPSAADEVNQWRSSKPLAEVKGRDVPPLHRGSEEPHSPSLADTEPTWSRGTKLRSPVVDAPSGLSTPVEDREWRSSRATSAVPSNASGPASVEEESEWIKSPDHWWCSCLGPRAVPAERRRLNLAPRSVPATPSSAAMSESSNDSKGIFGAAKPVDSAAREREAESKLAARAEERRQAREAEIAKEKESEEAGRKLAEEKARLIKEAQQKAAAEVQGGGRPPRNGPGPRHHSGNGPQGGPARRTSNDTRAPRSPPIKTEDGFEGVATRSRKHHQATTAAEPSKEKKEAVTRTGFSFAAAAAALGEEVLNGAEDDEEEVNGQIEKIDQGIKEVTV